LGQPSLVALLPHPVLHYVKVPLPTVNVEEALRSAVPSARLPAERDHLRHADQARHLVGEEPMRYDRYGFRVPAVIVSPYVRRDCVLSEVFDHTSVLKLVEEKWNLPALTRRDAAAV